MANTINIFKDPCHFGGDFLSTNNSNLNFYTKEARLTFVSVVSVIKSK